MKVLINENWFYVINPIEGRLNSAKRVSHKQLYELQVSEYRNITETVLMAYITSAINKPKKKLTKNLNETDKAYSDSDGYSLFPITPQISILQSCKGVLPKEYQS